MKPIISINPRRKTEKDTTGTRDGPNDYQYYRKYNDGWELSIVCNYAVMDYELGLFEVAVWNKTGQVSPKNAHDNYHDNEWPVETTIIGHGMGFSEVGQFIEDFENDPRTALAKWHVDIENGI